MVYSMVKLQGTWRCRHMTIHFNPAGNTGSASINSVGPASSQVISKARNKGQRLWSWRSEAFIEAGSNVSLIDFQARLCNRRKPFPPKTANLVGNAFTGMFFIFLAPVRAEDEAPANESPVLVDLEPPRLSLSSLWTARPNRGRPGRSEISDEDSGINQDAMISALTGSTWRQAPSSNGWTCRSAPPKMAGPPAPVAPPGQLGWS